MARLVAIVAALASLLVACGGGAETGAPDSRHGATPTTGQPAPTPTTLPGGELETCEGPAGFTVAAPEDWATNAGDVVPRCTMFHPELFDVPRGTDVRVAAITAYTDPVPFPVASAPRVDRDEDRAVTVVAGRQATRVSYESGRGLYPVGTPITTYMVDVQREGGDPATLFLDTVGVGDFDHERNVVVLDRMFRTLDISGLDVELDPGAIAAYRGATGLTVTAESRDGRVCLQIPPRGEPVCAEEPAADGVHTVVLAGLGSDVHAGVTGEDVWRVDLVTPGGERHSYLPAPVRGTPLRAYAFPDTVDGLRRLVLYDITGAELRTVEPAEA